MFTYACRHGSICVFLNSILKNTGKQMYTNDEIWVETLATLYVKFQSRTWCLTSIILELRKLRQKDCQEFKVILDYRKWHYISYDPLPLKKKREKK